MRKKGRKKEKMMREGEGGGKRRKKEGKMREGEGPDCVEREEKEKGREDEGG